MTNLDRFLSAPLPCVPLFVPLERQAKWSGKWSCNWDTEAVKRAGGPWDTREDACKAILATGLYRLRPGTENNPHFDRV